MPGRYGIDFDQIGAKELLATLTLTLQEALEFDDEK